MIVGVGGSGVLSRCPQPDGWVTMVIRLGGVTPSQVFVSHAGPDTAWAEWVAWQLKRAGYRAELDLWDWLPGDSFINRMRDALDRADLVVALWSAAYFERERFTGPEWEAVFAARGVDGPRLVPLRLEEVTPPALLRPLLYEDLFGRDADSARRVLLRAVGGAAVPDRAPPFPETHVPSTSDEVRLPGQLPSVWNLPVRSAAFTGRDRMILKLRDRLFVDGPVVVQALYGLSGIGKTQLAIEYAHRFANAYEVVWWVDAEQPELMDEKLAGLAVALGLVDASAPVPVALAKTKAQLRGSTGWLVVFDNVGEPADLATVLPEGPGQVLITARHGQWGEIAAGCLEVDMFARTESVTLLRRLAPTVSESDADSIAERLGDLPLAITQAGGVLAETPITAAQYLVELERHAASLLDEGRPTHYPRSLAAALRLSIHRLAEDDSAAMRLLHICAMLAPEPIPLDLFTSTPPDISALAFGPSSVSPVAMARIAGRLLRYGLATRGRAPRGMHGESLLLHRLTQAVVRDLTDASERPAVRVQAEAALVAAKPDDAVHPACWPRWTALLPHILALDPSESDHDGFRKLSCDAVWYMLNRGQNMLALVVSQRVYHAWVARFGSDADDPLRMADHVGRAFRNIGDLEAARQLHQETFVKRLAISGPDHVSTLLVACNLGIDLTDAGEHEQACRLNAETHERSRHALGEDHPLSTRSANNLAVSLRALGKYRESLLLDQDTYQRKRRILGLDHPHTLNSAAGVAAGLRALGRHEEARRLDEMVFRGLDAILGADHHDTIRAANNLADDLLALGHLNQSRRLRERTLAITVRVLGESHQETKRTRRGLDGQGQ